MVEFEHTIFILIVLSGILNAKPPRQRWAIFILLIGVLLVFLPPAHEILLPWELILGLTLPLFLWQNIRRLVTADWQGWANVIYWGISTLIFTVALWLIGDLAWTADLLFGMIVASMIWRASESDSRPSYMSQLGMITLIFLLTEAEVAIKSPNLYIGGVFSAAFYGLITALFGLYLLRKVPPKFHSWICIGQSYFAYWFSFIAGDSAVTATLVSVMAFVWLSQYYQRGFYIKKLPAPLNTWTGFSLILILFLLLGWQTHQSVSILLLEEVIAVTFLGLAITWIGYKLKISAFQKQSSIWLVGLRVAVLLFPALLIWPRDILQQSNQLLVAIGIAVLVIVLSYMGLSFYFPKKAHSRIFPPQE
ncbi:MAG: hypothetical protein N2C13_05880 [Chloroflexota bacterium]